MAWGEPGAGWGELADDWNVRNGWDEWDDPANWRNERYQPLPAGRPRQHRLPALGGRAFRAHDGAGGEVGGRHIRNRRLLAREAARELGNARGEDGDHGNQPGRRNDR